MSFTKTVAFDFLKRAHEQQRLAHAYLICGPQGTASATSSRSSPPCDKFHKPRLTPLHHPPAPGYPYRRAGIQIPPHRDRPGPRPREGVADAFLPRRKKIGILFEADRLKVEASNAFLKNPRGAPNNSSSSSPLRNPRRCRIPSSPLHFRHPFIRRKSRAHPHEQQLLEILASFSRRKRKASPPSVSSPVHPGPRRAKQPSRPRSTNCRKASRPATQKPPMASGSKIARNISSPHRIPLCPGTLPPHRHPPELVATSSATSHQPQNPQLGVSRIRHRYRPPRRKAHHAPSLEKITASRISAKTSTERRRAPLHRSLLSKGIFLSHERKNH